jgi:hypothetical protein
MNADHDYQIGKDHAVCEDYALSGVHGDFAYAVVCDGCSSGTDVDFGARMLALSARETLRIAKGTPMPYEVFGKTTIRRADTVSAILPQVHPEFLDATLLLAWVQDGRLTAYLYGDGVFFHKTAKTLRAIHVDFRIPMEGVVKPAPAYLSYHLEPQRRDNYKNLGGTKNVIDTLMSRDMETGEWVESGTDKPMRPFDPVVIEAPVAAGDVIAVCSDGINSFRKQDDSEVDWRDVAEQFMGFKNFKGSFVRRRISAYLRDCHRDLTKHTDDVSVAAIVI